MNIQSSINLYNNFPSQNIQSATSSSLYSSYTSPPPESTPFISTPFPHFPDPSYEEPAESPPYIRSLLRGNLVIDIRKLHARYRDIVRTAPDEVSFALEEAWHDIFSNSGAQKALPRDPSFFKSPPGQAENLVTMVDFDVSMRMRQVIGPAFTDRAVAKQESIIQSYVTLIVEKLLEREWE
ncbi:hypothetical protein OCU04_004434 [Sclerotinia nivalis]|uniref:Uncharacterized protein n=1 Tax=Sclerotinia nivalis TaxID=352851 RepID=A0A9X0DL42_9HELO|nr:hypothetical protein OCU04_004434 [Sclerotinia nivalis]